MVSAKSVKVRKCANQKAEKSTSKKRGWTVLRILDEYEERREVLVEWAGNNPGTGRPWDDSWIPRKNFRTGELLSHWDSYKEFSRRSTAKLRLRPQVHRAQYSATNLSSGFPPAQQRQTLPIGCSYGAALMHQCPLDKVIEPLIYPALLDAYPEFSSNDYFKPLPGDLVPLAFAAFPVLWKLHRFSRLSSPSSFSSSNIKYLEEDLHERERAWKYLSIVADILRNIKQDSPGDDNQEGTAGLNDVIGDLLQSADDLQTQIKAGQAQQALLRT